MAELLGHEAALFLPTATMANQVALRALSRPGCEVARRGADARPHLRVGRARRSTPGLVMHGLAAERGPADARADRGGRRVSGRAACSCSRTRTAARAGGSGRSTSSARRSTRRASAAPPSISTARGSSTPRSPPASRPPHGRRSPTPSRSASRRASAARSARVLAGSARADRARVGGKVPLRRRAPPVGHRRGGDALRARPSRRAARRGSRARAGGSPRGSASIPPTSRRTSSRFRDEPGLQREPRASAASGVGNLRPGWLRAVTHLDIGDDDIDAAIPAMQEVLGVHA